MARATRRGAGRDGPSGRSFPSFCPWAETSHSKEMRTLWMKAHVCQLWQRRSASRIFAAHCKQHLRSGLPPPPHPGHPPEKGPPPPPRGTSEVGRDQNDQGQADGVLTSLGASGLMSPDRRTDFRAARAGEASCGPLRGPVVPAPRMGSRGPDEGTDPSCVRRGGGLRPVFPTRPWGRGVRERFWCFQLQGTE